MKKLAAVIGLLVLLSAFVVPAGATLITFDDLTGVPLNYSGFTWYNFGYYYGAAAPTGSGYYNGMVSSPIVVYNGNGYDAYISDDTTFTFNSAYFSAAWNTGLNIDIAGLLNDELVYFQTIVVNPTGATLFTFNWTGIDELYFQSYGGTDTVEGGFGTHFVMDNLTVNESTSTVPLPGAVWLLGSGLLGLAGFRKKFLC